MFKEKRNRRKKDKTEELQREGKMVRKRKERNRIKKKICNEWERKKEEEEKQK